MPVSGVHIGYRAARVFVRSVLSGSLVFAALASSALAAPLKWSAPVSFPGNPLVSISCPSLTLCVAGSDNGVLVSTDPTGGAGAWKLVISPPGQFPFDRTVSAVSCPSRSFCAAVSPYAVLTSSDPAGGASAWKVTPLRTARNASLAGVACGSRSMCVAYERNPGGGSGPSAPTGGYVNVSSDPAGGAQAWKLARLHDVPDSVTCLPRLCLLATEDGDVLRSSNPGRGAHAWRSVHVYGTIGYSLPLATIACASARYCLTFYLGFEVSTRHPSSGSAAFSWKETTVYRGPGSPPTGPDTGSCVASGFCLFFGPVYSGRRVLHNEEFVSAGMGKPWVATRIGRFAGAVSCVTASFCVAVGPANSVGAGLLSIGRS